MTASEQHAEYAAAWTFARSVAPRPERVTLSDKEIPQGHESMRFARNIVNQILDLSGADVPTRQAINDACDQFTARLLISYGAAREQALREAIAGEVERKAQHLNAAEDYGRGGRDGLNAAARIARGDTR